MPNPRSPVAISGRSIERIRVSPAFTVGSDIEGFRPQALNWVYPKSPGSTTAREDQKATVEQEAWVVNYFNEFITTLSAPDINDPNGYSKYIDPVSWVDHHMLNVLMMNVDALRLSGYLFKDREGPIEYGPVWDFDRSAESADNRDDNPLTLRSHVPDDYGTDFFASCIPECNQVAPDWWAKLFQDAGFWQIYVDRWQMWRDTVLSTESIDAMIDDYAAELSEAMVREIARWRSYVAAR